MSCTSCQTSWQSLRPRHHRPTNRLRGPDGSWNPEGNSSNAMPVEPSTQAPASSGRMARRWRDHLSRGDLVGIAATERHGGLRIREIATQAPVGGGGWLITGEKVWVSRLVESAAFVVFFHDSANGISAGVVDA